MISKRINVKDLGIVAQSDGDLYTNVKDLKGRVISVRNEAYARVCTAGKENIGKTEGTRVSMIVSYLKEELPVWQKKSMFPKTLAKALVDAHLQNKYYSTGSTKEYEQARKKAEDEEKRGIAPEKRSTIVCPSGEVFKMSLSENRKQLDFILIDLVERYLQLNGQPINFYPIGKEIVDGSQPDLLTKPNGTIQNYIWFGSLGGRSGLVGDFRDASYCDLRARGVFKKSAEGTSPKISREIICPTLSELLKYSKPFVPQAVRKEFERGFRAKFQKQ